jgi:hypothetical protein
MSGLGRGPVILAIAAALLIVALGPAATLTPVRGADICSTSYCASLQIVEMNGTGSGHVTSDPPGIDCAVSASGFAGSCYYVFAWSHLVSSIYVDVTVQADAHSYVCMDSCTGLGGWIGKTVALFPNDHQTLSPQFNLGNHLIVKLAGRGTGAGLWTMSSAGINCRYVNGVMSGACQGDLWAAPGGTFPLPLTSDPDPGSYGCSDGGYRCWTPDETFTNGPTWFVAGTTTLTPEFWIAVPVSVSITGSGTVVSGPAGISCPPTCSKWFPPSYDPSDDKMSVTATPAGGWHLFGWTGACAGTTGTTCLFNNTKSGSTIGVAFAPNQTPAPTSGPSAPPATPRPSSPAASLPPIASTPVATLESTPSAATPTQPAISPGAVSSAGEVAEGTFGPSNAPVAAVGSAAPPVDGSTSATGDSVGSGPDPVVVSGVALALLALVLVVGISAGFLLSRRRRREDAP